MTSKALRGDATTATNISIIEEAFAACALPMPHHCEDLDRFQASGLTFVGKFGFTAHSPFSMKLLASARLIKAATTKPGSTSTLLGGTTNSLTVRNTIEGSS